MNEAVSGSIVMHMPTRASRGGDGAKYSRGPWKETQIETDGTPGGGDPVCRVVCPGKDRVRTAGSG